MRFSVVFPHQEIGVDRLGIREWAATLERWALDEIEVFDHVVGGAPEHWKDGPPKGFARVPYTTADPFHEPLTLLAFLAGATERVGLATSVLILPQRQTVLVAKQCVELDLLSAGRFRLGVGVGWNPVEYRALGIEFRERGARMDEQLDLLRRLWAEDTVTFSGRWHSVDRAGLNPLPPSRRIPVWIGGMSDVAVARVARSGDGWCLNVDVDDPRASEAPGRLERAVKAAGRSREEVSLSGWIRLAGKTEGDWQREADAWAALGAQQIGVITNGAGAGPEPHLRLVERFLSSCAASLR